MEIPHPSFKGSEEDHQYRSRFIQWLFHQTTSMQKKNSNYGQNIPKIIIQFWHDLEQLPDDVLDCINSWNPLLDNGYQRIIFDDKRARLFIKKYYTTKHVDAFDLCYHPAMRCDYFRLCYIFKFGGFYVDTDEVFQGTDCDYLFSDNKLKLQPLCYDLATSSMVNPEVFLNDTSNHSNRIYYINNNPIIAPSGHQLIGSAIERATSILLQCSEKPDIQSTTGPGNLSACLVRHATTIKNEFRGWDFLILKNWAKISDCKWDLNYREDERNWRKVNNY